MFNPNDEISRRLAMLLAGECEGFGATEAARRFKFSRQRYYQLLCAVPSYPSCLKRWSLGPRKKNAFA